MLKQVQRDGLEDAAIPPAKPAREEAQLATLGAATSPIHGSYGSALKGVEVLNPAMNNTKWDELRLEMYVLEPPPSWSTLSTGGHRSRPDREWFYHFRDGGYDAILHLDIQVETPAQRELVRSALKKVHVPGEETPDGFRVFGYLHDGQTADFI